jgi:hypothetical protein
MLMSVIDEFTLRTTLLLAPAGTQQPKLQIAFWNSTKFDNHDKNHMTKTS